jgi:predicted TIM-barrel fold metal-dependent hydrolase
MIIVDSQVHLWSSAAIARPPGQQSQQPSVVARDLVAEMDDAGVSRAVIVPPNWNDATAQYDFALSEVRKFPDRLAVMAPLAAEVEENRTRLAGWRHQSGLLGLRLVFLNERTRYLTDGTAEWIWQGCERDGVPVMIYAPGFMPAIGDVAQRHPRLRIIVDHFGVNCALQGEAAFAPLPEALALARHPNVAVKASGAPGYATDPYPFRSIDAYIRKVYDAFGPSRLFWGSDLTRMHCSYRECVAHFSDALAWLTPADKELIMGRGLCEWIGWQLNNSGVI